MDLVKEMKELGYKHVSETKTFIEFKTQQYGAYTRIKIFKETNEVCKDFKSYQGNRGHRNFNKEEINTIYKYINS